MRRTDLITLLLLLAVTPLWLALAYRGSRVAALDVATLPVLLPTSGLHELEPLVDRAGSFRWTTGSGELRPPNPGGPLYLHLGLASGFAQPTPLELHIGSMVQRFEVRSGLHTYALLAPIQPGERVVIGLHSPAVEVDGRALGVVVQRLLVAGSGPAPPLLLAAFLLATLGGYALLRRASMPWPLAAGAILSLQGGAALWQEAGAWRYALLGGLLSLAGIAALGALLIERTWPVLPPTSPPPITLARRDWLALGGVLVLALALCLPWLAAPDPVGDLELSARRMGALIDGGFAAAFTQGGDYMPLRLFILRGLAPLVPLLGGAYYDPLPAITRILIKLPSLLALLISLGLIFSWARRYGSTRRATLLAGLYAIVPPVWINVAWWGQVDVLLTLPMLTAIVLLDRCHGRASWPAWAAGMLIKPQAIILAPVLYAATLRRYGPRGLAEGGLALLSLIALAAAPFVLIGQGPGLYQAAVGSVGRFPQVTNRAYNLWWLVAGDRAVSDLNEWAGISYRSLGMLLLSVTALLILLGLLRRPDGPSVAVGAAALALAFFSLPTQIHERYAFFALPFLLLAAAVDQRLLLAYALLVLGATINILGAIRGFSLAAHQVIRASFLPEAVAWTSLALLIGLLIYLWRTPEGGRWPRSS